MNRRELITTGPLAGLTAALLAGDVNAGVTEALVAAETPVMAQYREAMRIND